MHAERIKYKKTSAGMPNAASSFVVGNSLKNLITVRYMAPWLGTFDSPKSDGSWPTRIVRADPVMKPLTAGAGINSTSHPKRSKPTPKVIIPHKNARADAIICAS